LNIPYVTDQSNFDVQTSQRNKIRIEFLPNLFAQKGFEKTMKSLYKIGEKNQTTIALKSIEQSPHRHAQWAYEIPHSQDKLTPEIIAQLLKQLHASSAITS